MLFALLPPPNQMMVDGFLVVDKPSGITSHDVVAKVRRVTGIRKAGHAGTLDPLATGVVIVALGRATRLIRFLQDLEKEYEVMACFGVATDSLDADGAVIEREPMDATPDEVAEIAVRFVGRIMQIPPMVSALKVEGRRLYELAREGTEVTREARPVDIFELEILEVSPGPYPEVRFRVVCGKGTYVRVLADDMARALGGRAHLTALRRTRTGSLTVADHGVKLDELEESWEGALLSPARGLGDLPAAIADENTAIGVGNGVRFAHNPCEEASDGDVFRVLDEERRLLAVYRAKGQGAVPEVVLA